MSLILDALRKMEEERAARRGGSVDIRPAVLSRHGDEPPKSGKLITPVVAGTLLLLAGIGAGMLLKGTGPAAPPPHPVENSAAGTEERPASPLPPAVPQTRPMPVEPVRTLPTATVSPVPATVPPRKTMAKDPPATAFEPADPAINISGIAWQEERALRRAVVNGALVGEGAEVAGARIIEIRERSVKFSRGGRTFEVSYASAFPSR